MSYGVKIWGTGEIKDIGIILATEVMSRYTGNPIIDQEHHDFLFEVLSDGWFRGDLIQDPEVDAEGVPTKKGLDGLTFHTGLAILKGSAGTLYQAEYETRILNPWLEYIESEGRAQEYGEVLYDSTTVTWNYVGFVECNIVATLSDYNAGTRLEHDFAFPAAGFLNEFDVQVTPIDVAPDDQEAYMPTYEILRVDGMTLRYKEGTVKAVMLVVGR